ncbi:hypothetical protein GCM10009069_05270 [Algimonas arctica]|uniref:Uncharacterized protein n=1 Tax=Algimonas arctica TaxID=1479486 RepID=A0A8J3CM77_9PROT|nr:hypothetical protein [Algimonas arctica]GHA85102.1 hypothetical protein GCM10009069_05270 [Algimonas arctica]
MMKEALSLGSRSPSVLYQSFRLRKLKRFGIKSFVPPFCSGQKVLIVGAGPSATRERIDEIRENEDIVVSLNSAWKNIPDADVQSTEFNYHDRNTYYTQINSLLARPKKPLVFKPHSLLRLEDAAVLKVASLSEPLGSNNAVSYVHHFNIPGNKLLKLQRHLVNRDRTAIQWKGSLSLWIDICWLNGVHEVSLIGTDLGSENMKGDFVPHPTNSKNAATPSLVTMIEQLRRTGYLEGMKFTHHHYNDELRKVLSNEY